MIYDSIVVQPLPAIQLEDNSEGELDGESDGSEDEGEKMQVDAQLRETTEWIEPERGIEGYLGVGMVGLLACGLMEMRFLSCGRIAF